MSETDPIPPEPTEIRFACIGCGTMNPAGSEVCAGCGHRFAGADVVVHRRLEVRPDVPSIPSDNPYEPPVVSIHRAPTFQIGTVMGLIAVIAVCLAAFASSSGLGWLATFTLTPATLRTLIKMKIRASQGLPMTWEEKILTFLFTIGGVVLVIVSSVIAFGVTCVGIAMVLSGSDFPSGLYIALGTGVIAALGIGLVISRTMMRASRRRAEARQDRESIRWR